MRQKIKIYTNKIIDFLLKLLNVLFITTIIALVIIGIFKPSLIESFLVWVGIKILLLGNWNYLIAFLSSIIESFPALGIFFPGQQIMLTVGGFFGKNNLIFVIIVAIFGALIGNYVGYFLGIKYGDKFFKNYGEWFGLGKTELKILKKQIEKNGAWFIIFGKFHNFTRAFVPFIAGSMGMKQKKFWVYNIIGSILWATTIIILGVVFIRFYKNILDNFGYVFLGIILLIISYVYFFKKQEFKNYVEEKSAEIEDKYQISNTK